MKAVPDADGRDSSNGIEHARGRVGFDSGREYEGGVNSFFAMPVVTSKPAAERRQVSSAIAKAEPWS